MNVHKNLIDASSRTNPATSYFVKIRKKLKIVIKTTQCYLNVGNFRLRMDILRVNYFLCVALF